MRKLWNVLAAVVLAGATVVAAASSARPVSALVSAAWLQQQMTAGDLLIIDTRPGKLYSAAHIPGAVNVDIFAYGPDEPDAQAMQQRLQSWGVTSGRRIVVYDQGGSYLATRLYYELFYRGFPPDDLYLLDGGLSKWREVGGAVTAEPASPARAGSFRVGERPEARADLPEVLAAAAHRGRSALVDALDPSMYFGATKFFDRAGHLPHATLWPASEFFNADKTFKSAAQIRDMARHLGLGPQQQIYTYCGGGIAASVPYFALRFIAGYPDVKLFVGSQLAWVQDDRILPLWTYAAPSVLRDQQWLAGWTNPMLRAYGVARLSVIDVRAPDAFATGHIPSAVSIPAPTLGASLAQREVVTRLVAEAGVHPDYEAVIVSERGVDAHSALAYAALRSLGHARVSILAPGLDDWALQGRPLTRESPPVAASAYPRRAATAVFTTAADGRDGAKRVYIASGANPAAMGLPSAPIHLPYTQLLDESGAPKAAKDIWTAISKAGIPRFAELVFVADDPGEAAVNYYIFELMGYTHLRVLRP